MNKSENITELAAALAKAQAVIEGAVKDKANPAFRSKYADLGACWDAIRQPFAENGLSVVQLPARGEGCVEVETVLMHSSGQWLSGTFAIPVTKADAHGVMSATTYARRGALMAIAGIAPVDDDGNGATDKRTHGNGDVKPGPVMGAQELRNAYEGEMRARGEEPKPSPARQKALDYTKEALADIASFVAAEQCGEWSRDQDRYLEKLEANHPDLFAKVMDALDAARDRLRSRMAAA